MILPVDEFFSLRTSLPVVDVRSEDEFAHGNIPGAVSIPLLNNQERIIVGTAYKRQGQSVAIREGFRLVGPRLIDIIEHAERVGNEFIVYCWRGGMRSGNFCQFAGMAGLKTHQLKGGYKSYRRAALASFKLPIDLRILGGLTGSGKSELLRVLQARGEQVIDLEKLASHKGSVFGGLAMGPQPTNEQFQNLLFETIRQFDLSRPVWIEDESIAIGKIFLPADLWISMSNAPVVELVMTATERVNRLVSEYGSADPSQFLAAMNGITKRLGGMNYKNASELIWTGNWHGAIEIILGYYDKAYSRGIDRKKNRIIDRVEWDGRNADAAADHLILSGIKYNHQREPHNA